MRNECNIIRDILPLYIEGMVSDDTVSFVEEHLHHCSECQENFAKLKAPTEIDDLQRDTATRQNEAVPLKILKKKLQRKRIITAAISVILTVAALLGGFILLTQPDLINVSDAAISVEQVYRFETEDGPQFFVLYRDRYSGHSSSESNTLWDENREAPTLVINRKRAILNLAPTDSEIHQILFAGAQAHDTGTWDGKAQDFKMIDYTTVKFGNTVIWTEQTDSTQEVPEYVYVFYDQYRHPDRYTGATYGDDWIEIWYADGRAIRWDYEGNVLLDTSQNEAQ